MEIWYYLSMIELAFHDDVCWVNVYSVNVRSMEVNYMFWLVNIFL